MKGPSRLLWGLALSDLMATQCSLSVHQRMLLRLDDSILHLSTVKSQLVMTFAVQKAITLMDLKPIFYVFPSHLHCFVYIGISFLCVQLYLVCLTIRIYLFLVLSLPDFVHQYHFKNKVKRPTMKNFTPSNQIL